MNALEMKNKVNEVLESMDAQTLENRIAPVMCKMKPDHPGCVEQPLYGVSIVSEYGIPVENESNN